MAYYPDLGACDYFDWDTDGPLLAVGWLEFGRPVPTGQVSEQALARLRELLRDPWGPLFLGPHTCDFCLRSYGPLQLGSFPHAPRFNAHALGSKNVFVPGDGKVYVAPELILHYVDEYGYAPPTEFEQAVLACPPMGSPEYLRAISERGLADAVAEIPHFEAAIEARLSELED
jgi:hypothetical protein